jgi:hypothetical protein
MSMQQRGNHQMASQSDATGETRQRQRALARWENEGGKALPLDAARAGAEHAIPDMTNAEIVALRVRVIALENVLISLLATASPAQLDLVRQMAGYIMPRPGFTPHPLTIHAARHMVDFIERSNRFRPGEAPDTQL